MLDTKGMKRVMKEINEHRTATDRCYKLAFNETSPQLFYAIVSGLDGDFTGGEYIMKVKLPDNYPFGAPVISFETPNGKFKQGDNICLSITHFHSETWSPLLTLEKIINSVVSVLSDRHVTSGIGFINTDSTTKKQYARASVEWNKQHYSNVLSMNMI